MTATKRQDLPLPTIPFTGYMSADVLRRAWGRADRDARKTAREEERYQKWLTEIDIGHEQRSEG